MRTLVTGMLVTGTMLAGLIAVAGCSQTASSGPNGGDLVSIKDGTAYAELVSNADTGEVLVETWDKDLKTRRPIEQESITVGSEGDDVALSPHPADTDPEGTSSRFYGQADWVRGAGVRQGWMHGNGTGDRQEFEWQHGWEGGRKQGRMWEEMGEHRRMGGHESGPGGGPMGH